MMNLIESTDPKLQTSSLTCLIKTGYKRGILIKYRKLLEGFADDEKFKDMIPILIHGSSSVENAQEDTAMETDDKLTKKAKRKETKASIPKLEDDDRADVLPVVIKLLQSKLLQRKGAINKKNIFTRRNIVYQFVSTFNKETELPIVVNEVLATVTLSIDKCAEDKTLKSYLACHSFDTFVTFLNHLDVLVNQLGSLLIEFIPLISRVVLRGGINMTR